MSFPYAPDTIPFVDTAQMVEVDRLMMEDFRIELIQMMENAGRNLAALARARFLAGDAGGAAVVVLAGSGGNGGGALVCARRLHGWGARVSVFLARPPDDFTPVPAHQLDNLERMGVPVPTAGTIPGSDRADLVIDGLIGYSLSGAPRGTAAELIRWANAQPAPILALDAPSGVDSSSGRVYEPAIRAAATMTLALPKKGLLETGVQAQLGELYLADISVPPELYAAPGLKLSVPPLFAESDILRVRLQGAA